MSDRYEPVEPPPRADSPIILFDTDTGRVSKVAIGVWEGASGCRPTGPVGRYRNIRRAAHVQMTAAPR